MFVFHLLRFWQQRIVLFLKQIYSGSGFAVAAPGN
jgi:hypothetical protein